MQSTVSIKSFVQLESWKEAHKLALLVYSLTKKFPKDEVFALISQIRRAVVSITSNIAEGFSRSSWKEKIQFYYIALSSLTEVQNQLLLAKDLGYITKQDFQTAADQSVKAQKLLSGLIKKARSFSSSQIQNTKY